VIDRFRDFKPGAGWSLGFEFRLRHLCVLQHHQSPLMSPRSCPNVVGWVLPWYGK